MVSIIAFNLLLDLVDIVTKEEISIDDYNLIIKYIKLIRDRKCNDNVFEENNINNKYRLSIGELQCIKNRRWNIHYNPFENPKQLRFSVCFSDYNNLNVKNIIDKISKII
jgi:hypothetical protein